MVNWKAHPYSAEGVLFILRPQVVFRARVNLSSATYPVAEIPYDNVTYGSISDVKMGMTVLIGSTEGSADRGRMYVRGDANHQIEYPPGSNRLKIGYCSRGHQAGEVDLVDDSYITVLDLYEPWKRASRMLGQNGSVLKDYDLATFPFVPPAIHIGGIGGMAQMDFVNPATGKHRVTDYDMSTSYGTDGNSPAISSVSWSAPGGAYINGTTSGSAAPDLEFSPGARWVTLTCFDSNGMRGLPRVQLVVSLANSGGIPGFSAPVERVSKARWRLTPEGVTFEAELRQALDPDDYIAGTVVIWLVKEIYAGIEGSVTGYKVKFAGWLDYERSFGQANEYDFERSTTIYAIDTAQRAAQLRGFPSTMARESSPNHANKMKAATLDRYWWWSLVWHSSIPMLADCSWSGVNAPFTRFSSPGGSIYAIADNLAKANAYCTTMDSRGRLRMLPDPLRLEISERVGSVLQSLLPADIVRIDRLKRSRGRTGQVRATVTLGATANSSAVPDPVPDFSVTAPGEVEGQGAGNSQNAYPWYALSQTEATRRIGHDYERANAREERLRIQLAHGGDGGIEPALMQWVEITTDEDTLGWLADPLIAERCLVTAVEFQYDDEAATQTQSIEVERETVGTPGRVDPIAGEDTPSPSPPVAPYQLLRDSERIAAVGENGLARTTTFGSGAATDWSDYATWASLGVSGTILEFMPNGFEPGSGWLITSTHIYYGSLATGSFSEKHAFATASIYRTSDASFGVANHFVCVSFYPGVGTKALYTTDNATFTEITVSAFFDNHAGGFSYAPGCYVSPKTPGLVLTSAHTATGDEAAMSFFRSLDYGATWAQVSNPLARQMPQLSQCIHVPFNAPTEDIVFHASDVPPLDTSTSGQLARANGGSVTGIGPTAEGTTWHPRGRRSINTDVRNWKRLLTVAGKSTDISTSNFDVFLTDNADAGTPAYTVIEAAVDYRQCAIAGDDSETFYVWGIDASIARATDGVTLISQMGNLASTGIGDVQTIAGY